MFLNISYLILFFLNLYANPVSLKEKQIPGTHNLKHKSHKIQAHVPCPTATRPNSMAWCNFVEQCNFDNNLLHKSFDIFVNFSGMDRMSVANPIRRLKYIQRQRINSHKSKPLVCLFVGIVQIIFLNFRVDPLHY